MLIYVACLFVRPVCRLNEQKKTMHIKRRSISNGHEQWNWFDAAFTVPCATVSKKSAACLIAAIMNGVNFYGKSDSLRQKKTESSGKVQLAWRIDDVNIDVAESAGKAALAFWILLLLQKFRFIFHRETKELCCSRQTICCAKRQKKNILVQ